MNETGTQKGRWYMNRLDYFQFHRYPSYAKHKVIALLTFILLVLVLPQIIQFNFFIALPFIYFTYLAIRTFDVLRTRVCCHKGYFLYPKSWVTFFKQREVDTSVNDFDSIATMTNHKS